MHKNKNKNEQVNKLNFTATFSLNTFESLRHPVDTDFASDYFWYVSDSLPLFAHVQKHFQLY